MGTKFTDNFSILHLASGIIFYFLGFSFLKALLIHIVFEVVENNKHIIKITNSFSWWPGGKPESDNLTNILGDNFYFIIGWLIAYTIDKRYEPDTQVRGLFI
jgi:hypothetical protein